MSAQRQPGPPAHAPSALHDTKAKRQHAMVPCGGCKVQRAACTRRPPRRGGQAHHTGLCALVLWAGAPHARASLAPPAACRFAIYRTPPPAEATPLKLPPGVRQASSAIASTGSAAAGVLRGVPVVGGIGNFLKRTSVDSSSGSKPAAGGGDVGNSSMNSRSTAGEAAQGSGDSIISTSSGGSIVRLSNLPRVPKLASVLTSAYGCSFIRDGENIDKEMQVRC